MAVFAMVGIEAFIRASAGRPSYVPITKAEEMNSRLHAVVLT